MDQAFEVASMNVAGQKRFGFDFRKKAAGAFFGKFKFDLVGFQEFGIEENKETFGKAQPHLKFVDGKIAGDIYINTFAHSDRFSVEDHDTFWLTPDGHFGKAWDGAERGVTWARLREKDSNRKLLFLNAHLDNVGKQARIESVKIMLKWIDAQAEFYKGIPVIITMDANVCIDSPLRERWDEPLMRLPIILLTTRGFKDPWATKNIGKPRPCSFHARKGKDYDPFRDDAYGFWDPSYILYRGPIEPVHYEVLTTEPIDGEYPSDHFWLRAKFRWV